MVLPDAKQHDLAGRPTPTFEQAETRSRGFVPERAGEKEAAAKEAESEEAPETPSTETLGAASPDVPLKGESDRAATPEARQELPAADAA